MVRKCVFVFGLLMGVSALVLDGAASTAEACGGCGGCRSRCCRPRCCNSCYTTCYAPAPCCAPAPCGSTCGGCSTCGTYYAAPSCSTCGTGYYYPAPVNVVQVPGYGAQYGYAAPVLYRTPTVVYRAKYVTMR